MGNPVFNSPRTHRPGMGDAASAASADAGPAERLEAAKLRVARYMLGANAMVHGLLGDELFSNPALQILLDLYVQHREGRAVSTSSACIASGVPSTTALRWINLLARRGIVVKRDNPGDRRFTFLELSPSGLMAIEQFLTASVARLTPETPH